jgi:hypothetical protein
MDDDDDERIAHAHHHRRCVRVGARVRGTTERARDPRE